MFPKGLKTTSLMHNPKVRAPPQILKESQNIHIKEWKNAKIWNIPLALHQHLGIYVGSSYKLPKLSINAQVLVECQVSIPLFPFFFMYVYLDILIEFVVELEL